MITKKKHRAEVALVTEQLQKTQALLKDASEQNSHLEMQISTLKTLMREDEERNKKQLDPSGASIHEEPSKAIKEKIKSLEQKDLEQTQIIADLNAKLKQMQEAAAEAAPKPTDAGDDDDEKEGEKAAPPPAPPVPTADVEPDTNDDERAAKDSALIKELEQKVKEYAEKADELASELEKTKESHGSDLQAILQRLTDKEVQLAEKSDEVATLQQQVASSSKSLASKIQKSANQSLQKKVDALKKTNREASELAHTHQQQIKKLQSQLDERQSELRKLQQNLDSEKEVAEDLRGQLAVEKQSTADLQTQVSDLEKQVASATTAQQAAEENLNNQLSKVADMARKLEEATINIPQMESNIRLLRISNEKLEYQMEKAAEKAKEDSATIEQLRTDLQEKTRALSELEAAHETSTAELSSAREALSAKDAAMIQQLEAKDEEINTLQDEMDEAQVKASITQKRSASAIKTYKSELAKLRQRCGKLAASVANAEADLEKARAQMPPPEEKQQEAKPKKKTISNLSNLFARKDKPAAGAARSSRGRAGDSGKGLGDAASMEIAKRLQSVLEENLYLKEKISFLEENVQMLTSDLAKKKTAFKRRGLKLPDDVTSAVPDEVQDEVVRANRQMKTELKTLKVHLNVLKEQLQEKTEALKQYEKDGSNRLNESFECEL